MRHVKDSKAESVYRGNNTRRATEHGGSPSRNEDLREDLPRPCFEQIACSGLLRRNTFLPRIHIVLTGLFAKYVDAKWFFFLSLRAKGPLWRSIAIISDQICSLDHGSRTLTDRMVNSSDSTRYGTSIEAPIDATQHARSFYRYQG